MYQQIIRVTLRKAFTIGLFMQVVSAVEVAAQDPFHAVVLTTGATTMRVDALNSALTSARFPSLSNDGISYGASGYVAHGRALVGADITRVAYGEEGLSSGRTDDLSARQFLLTISLAAVTTRRYTLFPTVGVGYGHFDVALKDRNGGSMPAAQQPTFAELAENPGTTVTISGSHLLYRVGVGSDYLVTSATNTGGVVIGVRAGVQLAPNRTRWSANSRDVLAGPDASAGGPFLLLVAGFGGR